MNALLSRSKNLPIDRPESLVYVELPAPEPHDLLVRLKAIAVNSVDYKVR